MTPRHIIVAITPDADGVSCGTCKLYGNEQQGGQMRKLVLCLAMLWLGGCAKEKGVPQPPPMGSGLTDPTWTVAVSGFPEPIIQFREVKLQDGTRCVALLSPNMPLGSITCDWGREVKGR